ncbi:uncharacterized protein LOC114260412 [Camellia sinensis]|uniref:uncharacterized protein LOC114260412 n=1 Tax=Camellia sinensis TaxID=4442 RepID=UPI001036603C|nr:uncharacterized protein LOC114260412 [Camellia sinensis]XP_028056314.1 uncharacterized protein LOC114260412 [Camellia sinensis]
MDQEEDPDDPCYLCRQCGYDITDIDQLVSKDIVMEAGIFKDDDYKDDGGDPAYNRMEGTNEVYDVICTECDSLLGWRFIKVSEETDVLKTGRVQAHLNKLLMWDGSEMLYPDTLMVTFNQTTAAHFFLCRQCSTPLVLVSDLMHLIPDIMINAGIFRDVVNVDVAGEAHYRAEDANVVTDVNCKGCRKLLGWKFVFVPVQTKEVQTGRFLLHLEKLLRWDINDEPVENA